MEEAKYSFNIRFNLSGYDCQFTVRSDEDPGIATLAKAPTIIAELEKLGAVGERRWEKVRNGENDKKEEKASPKPKSANDDIGSKKSRTATSVRGLYFPEAKGSTGVVGSLDDTPCPNCGAVGEVEVIGFTRGGTYKQAPKCQACQKWLPEDK